MMLLYIPWRMVFMLLILLVLLVNLSVGTISEKQITSVDNNDLFREATNYPQQIWIYWEDGIQAAPELVLKCINSWQRMNPTWKVTVLGFKDLDIQQHWLGAFFKRYILPPTQKSDFIRLALLQQYGGVWVDATVYCQRPLNEWLPDAMREGDSDYFMFRNAVGSYGVCTWFIAVGCKEHPTINLWLEGFRLTFERQQATKGPSDVEMEYTLIHNTYAQLMRVDPNFAKRGTSMAWIFATWNRIGPHYAQSLGLANFVTPENCAELLNPQVYLMHKLNRRVLTNDSASILHCILYQNRLIA